MASLIRRKYKVKDKNGKTIQKQSPYWYIDYKTAEGTRKRIKGFKDKGATAQLAARLEKDAELAQAGVIDKYAEHRTRSLAEHLDDFKSNLLSKGTTAQHGQLTGNRIGAILDGCRFVFIADISASKVLRYLAGRRRAGLSIKSSNDYLQAIKQFSRWLVADRRMPDNPLAYLSGLNVKTDRRHDRRALNAEEIERLIKTTAEGKKHHKMTGRERAMLYVLALNTGLRANEIASLTWQSFKLDCPAPSVSVLAAFSKHRRDDILPLRGDLAEQFKRWGSERKESSEDKVFPNFNKRKGADMLKMDLEVAGIPYKDGAGRYADFHALRHTFVTNLYKSGVSPKVIQSLARHSTFALTMDTYTHIGLYDERAALDKLPELPNIDKNKSETERAVTRKTGTDNLPVTEGKSVYKPVYKEFAKKAFPDTSRSLPVGTPKALHCQSEVKKSDVDKALSIDELGVNSDSMLPVDNPPKNNWAGLDLNQRRLTPTGLQPVPFSHSGTDPSVTITSASQAEPKSTLPPPHLQENSPRFASLAASRTRCAVSSFLNFGL